MTAIEAIGGNRPVTTDEFASRVYSSTINPQRNPVKAVMDRCPSPVETPPMLGVFNDIPWYKFRASEAHAWARAGFTWVVNDGEHSQWEGYYGREQNEALLRLGLLPVQRLPREAVSPHGDALQLGARATMRPYGTTYEEAHRYFNAISFPVPGRGTSDDRGGFPMRAGDRTMDFSPRALLAAEEDVQGWLQFETEEYVTDIDLRDRILDLMQSRGRNKTCGFIGPFDAVLRGGDGGQRRKAIGELLQAATERGIHMGILVSPGPDDTPAAAEEAMVHAIEQGARLLAVPVMTSDLPYRGAVAMAEPFFRACLRCGF